MARRTPLYKYQLIMPYNLFPEHFAARHERSEVLEDDPEVREAMSIGMSVTGHPPAKKHEAWASPHLLMGRKNLHCYWSGKTETYIINVHSEEMNQYVKEWWIDQDMERWGCALVPARINREVTA